jgi:predicted N-acetyltransferase YhbS
LLVSIYIISFPLANDLLDLDMLAVIPEYRKLGIGGALVEWGTNLADENGKGAYVDASEMGAPVYARYGFLPQAPVSIPGETFSCTAYTREPKPKSGRE